MKQEQWNFQMRAPLQTISYLCFYPILRILVLAKAIAREVTAATIIMDVANWCNHARRVETGVDYR